MYLLTVIIVIINMLIIYIVYLKAPFIVSHIVMSRDYLIFSFSQVFFIINTPPRLKIIKLALNACKENKANV